MKKLIKDLMDQIFLINKKLDNKIFSDQQINEEKDNYEEFIETKEQLKKLLNEINKINFNNENQFCKKIVELHVLTSNLSWYFENLNDSVKKIIQGYPFSDEFIKRNS